jgi:hypothetical protein
MKSKTLLAVMIASSLPISTPVFAEDLSDLKNEIRLMREDYEQRIAELENKIKQSEQKTQLLETKVSEVQPSIQTPPAAITKSNRSFNPAISAVLNGQFNSYNGSAEDYSLSGFSLAGEGGLAEEGFSLGESEITMSASVDQLFFGQTTIALHEHEGETEVEIEEAFIETLGLGNGLTLKAGRFFAPIGYLNEKHQHAWNFADAPLIYRGLFGNQLLNDGIKASYVLPTDLYMEIGGTLGNGQHNPGNGENSGIGDWLVYAKTGGDISFNQSWQVGISHWQTSPKDRSYSAGHSHDGEEDVPVFNGDTDITNLSMIYKWSPDGNFRQKSITLLGELFYLKENGNITHEDEFSSYNGKQYGGYVEGIYQFQPQWRTGLRYDRLGSDLSGSETELLEESGLDISGFHPQRYSLMLEWLPSEFSRVRAQLNHDKSSEDDDTQVILQYTVSIGAHGAHSY